LGNYRKQLDDVLKILNECINTDTEEQLFSQWRDFALGKNTAEIFQPRRAKQVCTGADMPHILINDAMKDCELMALREFAGCLQQLTHASGQIMNVRSNYGTSIIMSLFGVKMAYMADEHDTLPSSYPFDNLDEIKKCLDNGMPDLNGGLCRKVFEMGEFYQELLQKYPKITKHVHAYHPDFQGPFDICEVLTGSKIFYALYDEPELIKNFLSLITDTYIAAMRKWQSLFPYNGECTVHWGMVHKGPVMLRNDSAMNISDDMFNEFILPYDKRILETFGGGAVHFCGKGDHYIESMTAKYPMLYALHITQPHMNDVDVLFENSVDKGINLLGFDYEIAREHVGRGFAGRLHSG